MKDAELIMKDVVGKKCTQLFPIVINNTKVFWQQNSYIYLCFMCSLDYFKEDPMTKCFTEHTGSHKPCHSDQNQAVIESRKFRLKHQNE